MFGRMFRGLYRKNAAILYYPRRASTSSASHLEGTVHLHICHGPINLVRTRGMLPVMPLFALVLALAVTGEAPPEASEPAPPYLHAPELPEAPAAVEPILDRAPSVPVACVAEERALVRILVVPTRSLGTPDHVASLFQSVLIAEVRKLHGVFVITEDEIRALVELEAERQLLGCDDEGCLAEIADALGVDFLLLPEIVTTELDESLAVKMLDARAATIRGTFHRRFPATGGEALFTAIGPAVAELLPDRPLRQGQTRGAPRDLARRLNPPPLPVWPVAMTGALAATALISAGAASAVALFSRADAEALVAASIRTPVPASVVQASEARAQSAALVANVTAVAGAVGVVGALGLSMFTDFAGDGDAL